LSICLFLFVHEIAIKANQAKIKRNDINDKLKLNNQIILSVLVIFSKIFKKLNLELSSILSKNNIGITDIAHQINHTINLFLDSLELSIYEKIYHQITIGISDIKLIKVMDIIFSSINIFNKWI